MYVQKPTVQIRLNPTQAEFIYWELLGLLSDYQEEHTADLEPHEEAALLSAVCQLESGLARSQAVGTVQLEQLRASVSRLKDKQRQ